MTKGSRRNHAPAFKAKGRTYYQLLRRRLEATPGVSTVSFSDDAPLTMQQTGTRNTPCSPK